MRPLTLFFLLLGLATVAGVALQRHADRQSAGEHPEVTPGEFQVSVLQAEVARLKEELARKSARTSVQPPLPAAAAEKESFSLTGLARLVETSRGLNFKRPPAMVPASRAEIHRRHAQAVATIVSPEAAGWRVRVYEALGFRWQPRHPLDEALTGLIEEQWAGFYDEAANTLFIDEAADYARRPDLRARLIVDLARILLLQNFDAARVPFGFDDGAMAAAVLPAGDALATQVACQLADRLWAGLTPAPVPELVPFFATPAWFKEWVRFPENFGGAYREALLRRDPSATADAAYATPPRSTAAVIHADAGGGDAVPPPVAVTLPDVRISGKPAETTGVCGELGIRLLLKSQLRREEIDSAATGWRGDAYAVFRGDDSRSDASVWLTEWRSPNDAAEFAGAAATTLLAQSAIQESEDFHRPGGHFIADGNGRFLRIRCLPDDRRVLVINAGSAEVREALFQAAGDH